MRFRPSAGVDANQPLQGVLSAPLSDWIERQEEIAALKKALKDTAKKGVTERDAGESPAQPISHAGGSNDG
jgi:hypothetical protein